MKKKGKITNYKKEQVMLVLDAIFRDIEDIEYFNINEMVHKYKDLSGADKQFLPYKIKNLAKKYGLIENILDNEEWFELTVKGINLKESGKGFNEFEKSLKPKKSKLYNENWIGYVITTIVFLFSVYQWNENKILTNKQVVIESKLDSLKIEFNSYKYQLLVLKEKNEIKKDTLLRVYITK